MAEVTEHDLLVEVFEEQVESSELDEDAAGGVLTDLTVGFSVSLAMSFSSRSQGQLD